MINEKISLLAELVKDIEKLTIDNTSLSEIRNLRIAIKACLEAVESVIDNYERDLISDANTLALHLADMSDDYNPNKFVRRHKSTLPILARYMATTGWADTKLIQLQELANDRQY
jgi:hypothetical protein